MGYPSLPVSGSRAAASPLGFHALAGLKALKPRLTIACKGGYGDDPDAELPSMVTCQNYLKLPNYSSLAAMERRMAVAIAEGQGSFHLS